MHDGACKCEVLTAAQRRRKKLREAWHQVKFWFYCYVWARYFYRHVMRFMHKHNWHYMPREPMNPRYGKISHWCQWCGLRGTKLEIDPNNPGPFKK